MFTMVSIWPWTREDNSPASFEKALSTLAEKISKSQTQLDGLRRRGRRFKALWTLYTSFAYLLCAIILFLVVGWKNWTALEYTAVAGSPLLIYLVRTGITTFYNFRVDTVTQRLEDQQAERVRTIDKLKAATKYNSTQELLEKYGGAPPKPKKQAPSSSSPSKVPKNTQKRSQTTSTGPPPPTANIVRPNQIPSQPSTPHSVSRSSPAFVTPSERAAGSPALAEFASNAFSTPPQYAMDGDLTVGGHWYDRVLDLLLGEDETLPKNRIALICQNCRLVNGLAPPGTKSLMDLGKWRCSGCGKMNGEEDEAVKAVQEMKEMIEKQDHPVAVKELKGVDDEVAGGNSDGRDDDYEELAKEGDDGSDEDIIEVKPLKGRPKGSRKKT